MKLNPIKKEKQRVTFTLEATTPAFANAMRRLVIDEVPTMAIEEVEFRDNSSILYDETVAHRLGLLPLKVDLDSYKLREEVEGEGIGSAECELKFSLVANGPGMVYAEQIKFEDPSASVVFPKMPIAKLIKDQKMELQGIAILGRGRTHMKWAPGHMFYKYSPNIKIGKVDNVDEVVKSCPVDVFENKGGKLAVKDLPACHLCGACEKTSNNNVRVEPTGTDFVVTMESWGQLNCKDALLKAADILDDKLEKFSKALKH